MLHSHLAEDPPALSSRRPDLAGRFDAAMAKAMAKQPADRFASCAALTSATRALAAGRPAR